MAQHGRGVAVWLRELRDINITLRDGELGGDFTAQRGIQLERRVERRT
jgi:hypothetical protein